PVPAYEQHPAYSQGGHEMPRRSQTSLFAFLLIALLVITSCAAPPAAPSAETAPTGDTAAAEAVAAVTGDLPEVPRNRTFVSSGWDFYNQVPSPTNFNPYAGILLHQRNNLHYTVNEALFYSNYPTGETIPWLGESWEYNEDFTGITLNLRDG